MILGLKEQSGITDTGLPYEKHIIKSKRRIDFEIAMPKSYARLTWRCS